MAGFMMVPPWINFEQTPHVLWRYRIEGNLGNVISDIKRKVVTRQAINQ
jgi:hypothetical protein